MFSRPCPSRANRCQHERGAITIEFAIVLTGIVALLAVVLLLLGAAITSWRCTEVAYTGARMTSIGESAGEVEQVAEHVLGSDARVQIAPTGKWVTVTVSAKVPNSPIPWEVSSSATAYLEPAAQPMP